MKSGKSRLHREKGKGRGGSGVKSRLRVFSMEDCLEGFGPCYHGSQEVRSCVHLWDSFGVLLCIAGWPQTPSSPPVSAAWGSTAAQLLDSRITHCWGDCCESGLVSARPDVLRHVIDFFK